MSRTIVLDSGPLGLATNPSGSRQAAACGQWLSNAATGGATVMVPEIADYEVRRELLRARRTKGVARLDALIAEVEYLPITTSAMRQAARFWAEARQQGHPTAADPALDGDVILAAQTATLGREEVIVATTNVRHLSASYRQGFGPTLVESADLADLQHDASCMAGGKMAGDSATTERLG